MKAGEIATLVDVTYQLVGRRTAKLHEMGLVHKKTSKEGATRSTITDKARQQYFGVIRHSQPAQEND
jgi:DNA-binding MarR family transcriptional regulator